MKAEDKDLNRLIDKVDRILEKELPKDFDSLIEWGEKYANQKVIEELQDFVDCCDVSELVELDHIKQRIKELKQEI